MIAVETDESRGCAAALRDDAEPHKADCFQLLVNGWEILKAYSELVDPIEQRRLFVEQDQLRRATLFDHAISCAQGRMLLYRRARLDPYPFKTRCTHGRGRVFRS